MFVRIVLALVAAIVVFVGYVATRDGKFHYERSGVIQASKEKIFPYISNLQMGEQWSPYEKMAPSMKKSYLGQDGQVGSKMEFESKEAGSGIIEIVKIVPGESVELKLTMTAPIRGDNIVEYKLTSEDQGTRFTWSMRGEGGFLSKLMSVLIDCEKMVGDQFSQGIASLKTLVEGK